MLADQFDAGVVARSGVWYRQYFSPRAPSMQWFGLARRLKMAAGGALLRLRAYVQAQVQEQVQVQSTVLAHRAHDTEVVFPGRPRAIIWTTT